MSRIILIEGIPGSGKTTTAKNVKRILEEKGKVVKLFNEGDLHPFDLAWQSYITTDEFNRLLLDYPEVKDKLKEKSLIEGEYTVIAHHHLGLDQEHDLMKTLSKGNIFDKSYKEFTEANLRRWEHFSKYYDKDIDYYVVECVYYQNHITEMILKHGKTDEEIKKHLKSLINHLKVLDPLVIYLNPEDISVTIKKVAEERKADNPKYKDWIDLVIEYVCNSRLGKERNWSTYEDALKFFKIRKEIELSTFDTESVSKLRVDFKETSEIESILERKLNGLFIREPNKYDYDRLMSLMEKVLIYNFELNDLMQFPDVYEFEYNTKKTSIENTVNGTSDKKMFIATLDTKIVGMIEVKTANQDILGATNNKLEGMSELATIFVDPDYHRKGIGNKLIEKALIYLDSIGVEECCLDSGYSSAQKVWQNRFGKPTYHIKDYFDVGYDIMVWVLNIKDELNKK